MLCDRGLVQCPEFWWNFISRISNKVSRCVILRVLSEFENGVIWMDNAIVIWEDIIFTNGQLSSLLFGCLYSPSFGRISNFWYGPLYYYPHCFGGFLLSGQMFLLLMDFYPHCCKVGHLHYDTPTSFFVMLFSLLFEQLSFLISGQLSSLPIV